MEIYEITIERNENEFAVKSYNFPHDNYGKKILSILLAQVSQHLQDEIEGNVFIEDAKEKEKK